ncbi:MAG TPA: fibronectin type III domain-containing protein, partial [Fibrella sp.]
GPQTFIVDDIRLVAGDVSPDMQAPTAPANLTTSNVTATSLRLTWTASTDNIGVTAYEVYQGSTLLNGNMAGTSFDVAGLTCNTSYNFAVRAKDAAGNVSPGSNIVYIMSSPCADSQAPTVPTNVVSSSVTASGLTLSWAASTDNVGVTAYEVYQNGTLLNGNVAGTSLAVSGLVCGTTYTFTVLAKDAAGNKSAQSVAVSATTVACPPALPTGSEVIYDEALNTNWQEWGWSINSNYGATNPVKVGQKSLSVNYTDGWGGWAITRSSHFITSPQTTIRFWIYATTNKMIGVCTNSENDSGQSPYVSFQPTPNVWQEVVITMPQLANPAKIKRLTIQSQASGTNLIYVDNVRFEGSFNVTVSNVTTTSLRLSWTAPSGVTNVAGYDVYQNGNLLNGNVPGTSLDVTGLTCGTGYSFSARAKDAQSNGLVTSVPVSVSTVACPGSSTVEMIYDEAFNPGWDDWSWGLVTNYANSSPVKVGQKSAALTFDGWGAWSIFRKTALAVTNKSTIRFWIYPTTNKTLTVTTYAENDSQASKTYTLQTTPNVWQEVVITMPQLGNPTRIKRLVLNMPTSGPNPVYLDNVRIETPNGAGRVAVLSEEAIAEGRMTISPNPTDGPIRVQVLTDEAEAATVSVLNLSGGSVASQSVQARPGFNEYTLDLSGQASGTYLVQWQTATKRLVQRLVLVK